MKETRRKKTLTKDTRMMVAFVMVHLHWAVFFDYYYYCDDLHGRVFLLVMLVTMVDGHLENIL